MFNNKDKQKEDSKVEIKVSPLFTKADTVRDTVTGIIFTSSNWVEVEAKDAERLLNNTMDIFIGYPGKVAIFFVAMCTSSMALLG